MGNPVENKAGYGFGTAPVFLASVSTILGAILFLRFGYCVAHLGIFGALMIILIAHIITIPTGLAVAEIATNLKVEGGGEYYIISRSFGKTVGGAIGISLYFSQAISVAFYMIAFSEAFRPLFGWFEKLTGIVPDIRMVGIPATIALLLIILYNGANLGVSVLWVVVIILGVSLGMFFLGHPITEAQGIDLLSKIDHPDSFFIVFAIIFPAFTGMTAGVGLSGDLKNPRRSIPLGTLLGTVTGMLVYIAIVFKLGMSATPDQLVGDQFVMAKIALWGPIIPIGLAAATISSAIGSILVAPRTLQALAADRIFPSNKLNKLLSSGRGKSNDPFNATVITSLIAIVFVSMGSVDFVAQIISIFFMVTYGSLCSISFLEHFSGDPSYRPTFRSKWYLSLIGAVACFVMMYQMQPGYALLSALVMFLIYYGLKRSHQDERDLSEVIQGVLFQLTRKLQVLIQRKGAGGSMSNWRPSFIALSSHSLTRLAPFDMLRWVCHHYGFGTFVHFVKGPLNEETHSESRLKLERLVNQVQASDASVYVDTIVSPSFQTAVAQIVQIPGISGLENNSILFDFHEDESDDMNDIIDNAGFAAVAGFNICILRHSERHFGYKHNIHIWLTPGDYQNANLMILLAYIISGHPEWDGCDIELYAAFYRDKLEVEISRLNELIAKGRIPISPKNVNRVPLDRDSRFDDLVNQYSENADLVLTGFSLKKMQEDKGEFIKGFGNIRDIMFVRASQQIFIIDKLSE